MKHLIFGFSAAIAITGTPAFSEQIPGIQNHEYQLIFYQNPCTELVSIIDSPNAPSDDLETLIQWGTRTSMIWGMLLGYEMAHPGIRGSHETILMRLRSACSNDPTKTAFDLLESFDTDK